MVKSNENILIIVNTIQESINKIENDLIEFNNPIAKKEADKLKHNVELLIKNLKQ